MQKKSKGWGGYRPNAGRKATVQDAVRVTVDVPATHVAKLDELAKQQGRSRSDMIREAIEKILE